MSDEVRLKFTGFHVEGTARVLCWDGVVGTIRMDPFDVATREEIPRAVNDGRFGCEAILEADCMVYRDYEGHGVFEGNVHYAGPQLADAKRGV